MYNVFRKAKDSTKIRRTVIKQMLTMFLTCDNGLISAIFLRNLCVQKTKPVRSLRNLCVTIDQCDTNRATLKSSFSHKVDWYSADILVKF